MAAPLFLTARRRAAAGRRRLGPVRVHGAPREGGGGGGCSVLPTGLCGTGTYRDGVPGSPLLPAPCPTSGIPPRCQRDARGAAAAPGLCEPTRRGRARAVQPPPLSAVRGAGGRFVPTCARGVEGRGQPPRRRADWLRLSPPPPRSPAQRHVTARRSYGRGSCAAGRCDCGVGVRGERGERHRAWRKGLIPLGPCRRGRDRRGCTAAVRGGGARCGSLRVSGPSAAPVSVLPADAAAAVRAAAGAGAGPRRARGPRGDVPARAAQAAVLPPLLGASVHRADAAPALLVCRAGLGRGTGTWYRYVGPVLVLAGHWALTSHTPQVRGGPEQPAGQPSGTMAERGPWLQLHGRLPEGARPLPGQCSQLPGGCWAP